MEWADFDFDPDFDTDQTPQENSCLIFAVNKTGTGSAYLLMFL